MKYSQLSLAYLNAMVQSMYQFEAHQVRSSGLLTSAEVEDFYLSYMSM